MSEVTCPVPSPSISIPITSSLFQAATPPLRLLCALYEAISDPVSLDDSGVATAAAAAAFALRARGYDLGESGRFPGLYKLLAHDDAAVRAEVGSDS